MKKKNLTQSDLTQSDLTRPDLTQLDPDLKKQRFGINLIVRLSQHEQMALQLLQHALAIKLGQNGLFSIPPNAIHLTVMPLIWARNSEPHADKQTWQMIQQETREKLDLLFQNQAAFPLAKGEIKLFPNSIIVQFDYPNALKHIRTKLKQFACLKPVLKSDPSIAHITLFRFTEALCYPTVKNVIDTEKHRIRDMNFSITEVLLTKEIVYPSIEWELIQTYSLQEKDPLQQSPTSSQSL